jgi:hypothetical protein
MKKTFVIPAIIIALFAGQTACAAFPDVTESTDYATAIEWMNENGVIQGYPDGTFKPDQCVNRAEFLKMMYLSLEENIVVEDGFAGSNYYDNFFSDTSTDEWYWPYVEQALRDDAIEGYPDGTFKPGQCVNKAEAVKMAVLGFDIYDENAGGERQEIYMDVMPGTNWFDAYIYSAVDRNAVGKEHVFVMDEGQYFDPGESMSRKEVAEMLYRMKTLTDNKVFGYVDTMSPETLNYYVSPTSGVSFLMPDGWWVISDNYYTTASGVKADYPTIIINGPTEEGEETIAINQRQMQCQDIHAQCLEINENYKIGAYDPSLEASYLVNKILLTFRESNSATGETYNNEDFNLSFIIPDGWYVDSEEINDAGPVVQLRLTLKNSENSDISMSINTPPIETGYENATLEEGFAVNIDGLTLNTAQLFRYTESNNLMARNSYYINEENWQSNIEFFLSAPGDVFDTYLPDYYKLLESTDFSNLGEIAFDSCGTPSDYTDEGWWTAFVDTWDAYLTTLPGTVPNNEALNENVGDYCLAVDKSMFIFIPDYYENSSARVFKYDINADSVEIAEADGPYNPAEFGARIGEYIPLKGIHDYYGCEYTAGNYYYSENRVDTSIATSCSN